MSIEWEPGTSRRKWLGAQMIRSPAEETGGERRHILWQQEDSETQAFPFSTTIEISPLFVLKDLKEFFFKETFSIFCPSM